MSYVIIFDNTHHDIIVVITLSPQLTPDDTFEKWQHNIMTIDIEQPPGRDRLSQVDRMLLDATMC